MKSFTEDLIYNKTSDINDEKIKTVCISDKPDHVSTADQIREKPFDLILSRLMDLAPVLEDVGLLYYLPFVLHKNHH
jgi:hypothetical protein